MTNGNGYIYLIMESSDEEKYKIGRTNQNIEERMRNLQTGNPNELTLISYYETKYPIMLEKMLHIKFKSKNILNEWFDLSIDEISKFQETCKSLEETILSMKENPFVKLK